MSLIRHNVSFIFLPFDAQPILIPKSVGSPLRKTCSVWPIADKASSDEHAVHHIV